MGEMNIAESRRPQNGRMTYYVGPREIDLRLSSHPTVAVEKISLFASWIKVALFFVWRH